LTEGYEEREWREDDLAELQELLKESVEREDFTREELHDALVELGDYSTWDETNIFINGEGEFRLNVDGNEFFMGWQEENAEMYAWLEEHDVPFQVIYEPE
jgi:hypothetical protein